ncbi:hypothetical protein [Bremerella sp.]|uniref:hypothetical protein n=1 Tax=Bremerella sp. TaxID=2795602 RepID=UPI00391A4F20
MSTSHEPSAQFDASSHAQSPQVVVRAGKTYVCSACGTLVEIPAEVVGQLVLATNPAAKADPPKPAPSQPTTPKPTSIDSSDSKEQASGVAVAQRSPSIKRRPPQPRRPQPPTRENFVGQQIDGLTVPSAKQLDRAFAWVSFHLRVLDRQNSEINRLRKRINQPPESRVPCPRPRGHAEKTTQQETHQPHDQQHPKHAHEDVSMAPEERDDQHKRGPP